MKPKRRVGFSLLEVILATAILLACLIVLGQMAYVGRRNAESAADATTAQLICRSKLNEILVGAAPVASVESQPVADMPGWAYSVEVESLDQLGLVSLRVTAMRDPAESESDASQRSGEQFALTRWMHDANSAVDESADFDWNIDSLFESPFDAEGL